MEKDTEKNILKVARKHFVQKGFAATRTQEIADEVGVNKALVHYYFRTKEKLYLEIVKQVLDSMVPRVARAMSTEGDFWERVEAVVETYTSVLIKEPDTPFFIMSELSQQRERFVAELQKRAAFFPAIQQFLIKMQEAMATGEIKDIPPVHLMLNIISMTVFPFMAKPVFCTIFSFSESDFTNLMMERKAFIMSFLRGALAPDT
jgi:AcrR family transcriptional regulator